MRRCLFDDLPVTRERAAEVMRSCLGLNDGLGLWTICLREDSFIVGAVGLMTTSTVAEFECTLIGLVEPLVSLSTGEQKIRRIYFLLIS